MRKDKYKEAVRVLENGGIGVLRTDTIYGILGQALNKSAVLRVYKTKNRDFNQPSIVLISGIKDLDLFGIVLKEKQRIVLGQLWPGKISIILPCRRKFLFSNQNPKSIAFRLPNKKRLRAIIEKTGPLIAPSANPNGMKPARNIDQAKAYFKDSVDFYIDGGTAYDEASTLVSLVEDRLIIHRRGKYRIPKKLLKRT